MRLLSDDLLVLILLLSVALPLALLLWLKIRHAPEPAPEPQPQVVYHVVLPLSARQIEMRCWRVEAVLAAHKAQCRYATNDGRRWLLTGPGAERAAMELKEEIALSIGDPFVEVCG